MLQYSQNMNHAFLKILVSIALIILVGGGFFAWQYFITPEEKPKETKVSQQESLLAKGGTQDDKDNKFNIQTTRLAVLPDSQSPFLLIVLVLRLELEVYQLFLFSVGKNKEYVVINNQEGKRYDNVSFIGGGFIANGQHFLYKAEEEKKEFVVMDTKEGLLYDTISLFVRYSSSPKDLRLAYGGLHGEEIVVVIDGIEIKRFDRSDSPRSSPRV